MGIAMTLDEDSERREFEDFRQTLVALAAIERTKQNEEFKGLTSPNIPDVDLQDKLVCVTSGVSFLGIALVNRLLLHGYSVRILVDNQEDVEKLREMQVSGEMMMACNNRISVVMAKPTEIQGLMEAFDGCRGVFHTSAFADPAGISGYSESIIDGEILLPELPPFKRLTKAQIAKLSKALKKSYFDELEYREKLFMRKQLKDEKKRRKMMKKMAAAAKDLPSEYGENVEEENSAASSVPVPMPDLALPASFDSDNPTHRYRSLDSSNPWLVRPVLDTLGWDHDVGYEGINVERLFVAKDKLIVNKQFQVVMTGGAMTGRGDLAYGGSLKAQLRDKDYPLGRFLSTLGLSVMDWHGDLAIGCQLDCLQI